MDQQTTILELRQLVRAFCTERDWDQFHGPKDLAIGLVTEAAELLERFRFLSETQCLEALDDPVQREAIEDETADALFFLLRFADRFGIDLDDALRRKIAKNAERYPVEKARASNAKLPKP